MQLCSKQQQRENKDQPTQLCWVEVVAQEANQPGQHRSVVGGAEVGIGFRFRHQVMPMVVPFADVVIEACIKPQTQSTDALIDQPMPWYQAVVHGVVGQDEQAGVQKAADQDPGGDHQGMQLIQVNAQADDQGHQPGDSDQCSQLEAPLKPSLQAVTWHQA